MRFKYIKYLSINKIANLLKLFVSYLVSVLIARPIRWGMPASIAIEPTNRCNLKCPECPTGNESLIRIKSESDINLYHNLIDEIGKYLLTIIYYFQGEPFLNPDLFEMINYASQRSIYTITSTNGHFLDQKKSEKIIKSGLDKLIISLDGISPEIYEIYRQGGNLNKVIEGIKTIVAAKKQLKSKTPKIVIQYLVFRSNQHQIEDAKVFANELGVDKIVFKTAQIYNFKNGNPQIPDISKYSRYKKNEDGTYSIKSKLKNRCWRMWTNPVITASGEIAACCFDKNAEFGIGNISKTSFQNRWKSKEYNNFRKKIFTNRKAINICTNCTEGLKKVIS